VALGREGLRGTQRGLSLGIGAVDGQRQGGWIVGAAGQWCAHDERRPAVGAGGDPLLAAQAQVVGLPGEKGGPFHGGLGVTGAGLV
jgi:hypothetical protein